MPAGAGWSVLLPEGNISSMKAASKPSERLAKRVKYYLTPEPCLHRVQGAAESATQRMAVPPGQVGQMVEGSAVGVIARSVGIKRGNKILVWPPEGRYYR